MPKLFEFVGSATLDGVRFLVIADTETEAREKAANGDWQEVIKTGAGMCEWQLDAKAPEVHEAD